MFALPRWQDKLVLPLPYAQLLKIFEVFFVFTLPFVIASHTLIWTPIVAGFAAVGFFGIDAVGAELEGPFGIDDNDFALLLMGSTMCNDLDAMVRTVNANRIKKRWGAFEADEGRSILDAATEHLSWGEQFKDGQSEPAAPSPPKRSPAATEPQSGTRSVASEPPAIAPQGQEEYSSNYDEDQQI